MVLRVLHFVNKKCKKGEGEVVSNFRKLKLKIKEATNFFLYQVCW